MSERTWWIVDLEGHAPDVYNDEEPARCSFNMYSSDKSFTGYVKIFEVSPPVPREYVVLIGLLKEAAILPGMTIGLQKRIVAYLNSGGWGGI